MRLFTKSLLAVAVLATVPMLANAESDVTISNGPITAAAHLDFRVTVPQVLFLQVGTGLNMTDSGTVDLIDFVVPAASVDTNGTVPATAASGDLGNGIVTARVFGNNGNIRLSSSTTGALSNGSDDTISYSQIVATSNNLGLSHPTLLDGAINEITLVPTSGKVVNRNAEWTFSYNHTNTVAAGTYGGVGINNGRVTYTASMP